MNQLLLAALLFAATPTAAAPADDFKRLLDDHYAWLLRENPVQATALGVRDHDAEVGDPSQAHRRRGICKSWMNNGAGAWLPPRNRPGKPVSCRRQCCVWLMS